MPVAVSAVLGHSSGYLCDAEQKRTAYQRGKVSLPRVSDRLKSLQELSPPDVAAMLDAPYEHIVRGEPRGPEFKLAFDPVLKKSKRNIHVLLWTFLLAVLLSWGHRNVRLHLSWSRRTMACCGRSSILGWLGDGSPILLTLP